MGTTLAFILIGFAVMYCLEFFLTIYMLKTKYNKRERSYIKIIKMIDKRMTRNYGTNKNNK